jgi:hypothetical protein
MAINKVGHAVYLATRMNDGKVVSSGTSLSDNQFGPDLESSQIEIQVSPLSMNLKTTSYGQSVRIMRNEKIISLEDVKTGILFNVDGSFIASFWIESLELLPGNVMEFNDFTLKRVEDISRKIGYQVDGIP